MGSVSLSVKALVEAGEKETSTGFARKSLFMHISAETLESRKVRQSPFNSKIYILSLEFSVRMQGALREE
jgi:hypothetical protein